MLASIIQTVEGTQGAILVVLALLVQTGVIGYWAGCVNKAIEGHKDRLDKIEKKLDKVGT